MGERIPQCIWQADHLASLQKKPVIRDPMSETPKLDSASRFALRTFSFWIWTKAPLVDPIQQPNPFSARWLPLSKWSTQGVEFFGEGHYDSVLRTGRGQTQGPDGRNGRGSAGGLLIAIRRLFSTLGFLWHHAAWPRGESG